MRLIFTLLFAVFSLFSIAQSPQMFNYQSVIRDGSGEIVANQNVSININIIEDDALGSIIYSEVHNTETNQYGLVAIKIGNGICILGSFEDIDWSATDYYLNIAVDVAGGNDYQELGTTQLISVPYALYAESSGDSYFNKNAMGHLFYNEGRIGIGTDNPQKALHIRRVTKNGQGVGQAQLLVEADGTSDATIYLGYFPNAYYNSSEGRFWRINSHKPSGDFSIADEVDNQPGGDGSVKRLVIKRNSGNVGIGIEEPERKLHVAESMRLEPSFYAPTEPKLGDLYVSYSGKLHLYNGSKWDTIPSEKYLNKNVSGHLFYNKGRIGIGTDDPQKALHIRRVTDNGQGVGQAQLMIESDGTSDATIYLGWFPNDSFNEGEGKYWRINSDKPNGNFSIADEVDNEPGGDGSVKRLVIERNTGNVGVGVTEPQRKLHISGAMRLEPQETAPENPIIGDMYMDLEGNLHLYNGTNWYTVNMTLDE